MGKWLSFLQIGIMVFAFILGTIVTSRLMPQPTPRQEVALTRFTFTEYHMGVDARIVVYAPNRDAAERACTAAFNRIAELDAIMSDYRADSELMLLCKKAGGAPVPVSADLFKVLQTATIVSRRSKGAFDVTVGPLVALWRTARKTGLLPNPRDIDTARKLVGWKKVKLNDRSRTVQLTTPGMKLDLGGIAKGYAIDEAQVFLKRNGINRALVEMGGDISVSGPPPDSTGWTIRIPNAGDDNGPRDLQFSNQAISTSGDTEQFVVIGGTRYSHVIDPRTGQAVTNRIQATVIAKEGLISDPLSKLLALLGKEAGSKVLKDYPGTKYYLRVAQAP